MKVLENLHYDCCVNTLFTRPDKDNIIKNLEELLESNKYNLNFVLANDDNFNGSKKYFDLHNDNYDSCSRAFCGNCWNYIVTHYNETPLGDIIYWSN